MKMIEMFKRNWKMKPGAHAARWNVRPKDRMTGNPTISR